MVKKVDPLISKYFSDMNKKRKNRVGGFKNPEVARVEGAKGRASQKANIEDNNPKPDSQQKEPA